MMNRKYMVLIAVFIVLSMSLAGCGGTGNSAEEDMAMDLGGDLMNPSDDEANSKLEWNPKMPDSVPEFTEGTIVQSNYTSGAFGTQSSVTMGYEDVTEESYNAYIGELENSIFTQATSSESGGIVVVLFADGENTLNVQYAVKSGQLVLSYSGN